MNSADQAFAKFDSAIVLHRIVFEEGARPGSEGSKKKPAQIVTIRVSAQNRQVEFTRSRTASTTYFSVDLVASSGRSIGAVAKELGLRDSVLRRWVELRGAGREPRATTWRPTTQAALPSADQAAELARLQRENERLRMERDILKNHSALSRACAA